MKKPKMILAVSFYKEGPNTYTSEDSNDFIPFESESAYTKYKNERGIRVKLVERVSEIIDGERVNVYYIERIPMPFRQTYLEGIPCEALQVGHEVYTKVYNKQKRKREEKRKKEGYINYTYPISKGEMEGSLTFTLTPKVKKYIENPKTVWGYFGHESRKHHMDEYIEYTITRVIDYTKGRDLDIGVVECVTEWMCSSSARHWMDNVEENNKTEFKRDFKRLILAIIKEIRVPEHISEEELDKLRKFLG